MLFDTTVLPAGVLISVRGGFRYADREAFAAAVEQAAKDDCPRVLLDLRAVTFMDSAALSVLAMIHQRLKRKQVEFGLLRPTAQVLKLLTISGIPKMMPVYKSEQEAAHPRAA